METSISVNSSWTYIEPSVPVGVNGVTGAVLGTGITTNLQSKPIKLEKKY